MSLADNPRYVNYARAHGRFAADQLLQDRKDWPGALMRGFTQWNRDRIVEFSKVHPEAMFGPHLYDQAAYDEWLSEWVNERATLEGDPAFCRAN
jgi:hypothetical protein